MFACCVGMKMTRMSSFWLFHKSFGRLEVTEAERMSLERERANKRTHREMNRGKQTNLAEWIDIIVRKWLSRQTLDYIAKNAEYLMDNEFPFWTLVAGKLNYAIEDYWKQFHALNWRERKKRVKIQENNTQNLTSVYKIKKERKKTLALCRQQPFTLLHFRQLWSANDSVL